MLYEFKNQLDEDLVFWSNNSGDLHHNGEYDISHVKDLPKELQRAYNELWSDCYGANCYLVEFKGKYGIAFEAIYDKWYADDSGISYPELLKIAKNKARNYEKRYSEYDIIWGENTTQWSDGSIESSILLIMPWDIQKEKFEEVGKYFGANCYSISE